jgi:hypothetical protein
MSISKLSRRSRATAATPSPEWQRAMAEIERFNQMRDALPAPGDSSQAARVARAEYIVTMLSGHFIHKGWTESFDQGRAADFVENVRHGSTRKFHLAMDWMKEHGQCINWLTTGDTRFLITGLAVGSLAAKRLDTKARAA